MTSALAPVDTLSVGSQWLDELTDRVCDFLASLADPEQPGRYRLCAHGLTEAGRTMGLGSSCFALKVLVTLGRWESLDESHKINWIEYLRSFQSGFARGSRVAKRAFIDPPLERALRRQWDWRRMVKDLLNRQRTLSALERLYLAETKQAISTLLEVGAAPSQPYLGAPQTLEDLEQCLAKLNWSRPWAAGGQLSCIATLLAQQEKLGCDRPVARLLERCAREIDSVFDPHTGGYFRGRRPSRTELINGAMKVITALEWLGKPVHAPERLVELCLAEPPAAAGCHIVDAVYVLRKCSSDLPHRQADVEQYMRQTVERIALHFQPDGGFSYQTDHSQACYYGVRIGDGRLQGDLHATCLLTWALAMAFACIGEGVPRWNIITP